MLVGRLFARIPVAAAVASIGWSGMAMADTIRVPLDQPSIQDGIIASLDGDTVLVAPGTYVENINFLGKAITVTSESGSDVTIIDGNALEAVVTFDSGEGPASAISGFTIRNGFASVEGGGIEINSTSPTVENNKIIDNAGCAGIGVSIAFGSPIIRGNEISGNVQAGCSAGNGGGGIRIQGAGSAQILDNLISDNILTAAGAGGGIDLFAAGTPVIQGNIIRNNSISGTNGSLGGGISLASQTDAVIVQNLIVGNSASSLGGGIAWVGNSGTVGPFLVNNTIADNSAPEGSAIFAIGQRTLINNNIIGAPGQSALSCVEIFGLKVPILDHNNVFSPGGFAYGGSCADQTGLNGNISADPIFADPALGDYRLQAGSPSIDAGDNAAPGLPMTDLDGKTRIADGDGDAMDVVDIGAYEFEVDADSVFDADLGILFASQSDLGDIVQATIFGTFSVDPDRSDGINPSEEIVRVEIGGISETIPAGSFLRLSSSWLFFGGTSIIQTLYITGHGTIYLSAKFPDPGGPDLTGLVPVAIQIGNDIGQTQVPFAAR